MLSALNAFVAYASHYHQNEWKAYFENPSPHAVNSLYLTAFKAFAQNIFVDKHPDWKGWNKISATSIAQNKRFCIYCDALMDEMELQKPVKKIVNVSGK